MGETVPEVLSTAEGGTQTEGTVSPFAITGVSSSYSSPLSKSVIINKKSLKFKYKRHQASISKEKEKNQYVVTKNISCLPEQDPNQAQ